MKKTILLLFLIGCVTIGRATSILIPMDDKQSNHLKAYGVAYWVLKQDVSMWWLLNYKGGSFLIPYAQSIEAECRIRNVSYDLIADVQASAILAEIAVPETNMDAVKLDKAPKMAVYSPKNKLPWDDAVTMVLTYAEIPYDLIYDEEVIKGMLPKYDWLHLHHEDFSGQYGRFYAAYRNAAWYQNDVQQNEQTAAKLGFKKVSELKLAVATAIKNFTMGGGFLFAMCSGTDSYDIALAAAGIDICESMFDGDNADPNAQAKLNFQQTFAFKNFKLDNNPYNYEFSDIDNTNNRNLTEQNDYFSLFDFSAKWDPVPSMLTQNYGTNDRFQKKLSEARCAGVRRNQCCRRSKIYSRRNRQRYLDLLRRPRPRRLPTFSERPSYRFKFTSQFTRI